MLSRGLMDSLSCVIPDGPGYKAPDAKPRVVYESTTPMIAPNLGRELAERVPSKDDTIRGILVAAIRSTNGQEIAQGRLVQICQDRRPDSKHLRNQVLVELQKLVDAGFIIEAPAPPGVPKYHRYWVERNK